MPRSRIQRIREKVRLRQHDMSAHAMEEMAEDGLDIEDVEQAIFNGCIARIERDDTRGTKYVCARNWRRWVYSRRECWPFHTGRYLIITVYEITALED